MSDDTDPFDSPRLLLEGAIRHIEAFEDSLLQLRKSKDWVKPQTFADRSMLIRPSVTIPREMTLMVFDITNNLRSALDHAVFAGTFALTGHTGDATKFPFGEDLDDLRGNAKRACKKVPAALREFLVAFGAHRTGNPILWGLNKLRNTKSHRVLLPIAGVVSMVGMGEPTAGTTVSYEWDPHGGLFKPQVELSENTEAGGAVFAFRLEAAIGTGTFKGEPALRVFDRMLREVQRVVEDIEAETARLKAETAS